jgi:DNA-binding MarR family transcriptional regulator
MRYGAAVRWRRAVERELASVELTLTQWFVLEATAAIERETGDATNQSAVAARADLDRMTTSQVMSALSRRGLVDRGPDMCGRGYRIFVTPAGLAALRAGLACIEAASAR